MPTEPLTGAALLAKFAELGHLSDKEKARACGYYTVTKKGTERVNILKFHNTLIEAHGIDLDSQGRKPKRSRGGREDVAICRKIFCLDTFNSTLSIYIIVFPENKYQ